MIKGGILTNMHFSSRLFFPLIGFQVLAKQHLLTCFYRLQFTPFPGQHWPRSLTELWQTTHRFKTSNWNWI